LVNYATFCAVLHGNLIVYFYEMIYFPNKFFTVYRHGSAEKGFFLYEYLSVIITDQLVGASGLCAASNSSTDYCLRCIMCIYNVSCENGSSCAGTNETHLSI
jgi:hypothetical protein